ncbi:LytTR family DNA-binding domain-containing protein [Telluribacter sp.]|jgi:DNA-binding LytR/AlgR family response regulator|uniref:LytTR family DNA-binding domain-containing protein n=1 Tax=Telluribacter sp. TaxID=1978767 RepID=UPI002E10B911|nr:LytTR family DNA-binding domain-containing protein [Telluribacter sp.]
MMTQQEQEVFVSIGAYTHVNPREVVRLEARRNYTVVHQVNGRQTIVSRTLKWVDQDLQPHGEFLRLNRKDVVNLRYVVKHCRNNDLLLCDQTRLTPSRRKLRRMKEADQV